MHDRAINLIDHVLHVVLWMPAKLLHRLWPARFPEKCSRCAIRVRYAQVMLLLLRPLPSRERVIWWRAGLEQLQDRGESLRAAQLWKESSGDS